MGRMITNFKLPGLVFWKMKIEQLLVDTITTATRFSYTFSPGKYEWRIRARNSISETYYRKRLLKVDSATTLANQRIILRSPSDGSYTNNKRPELKWEWLAVAQIHRLQLHKGDFGTNLFTQEETFSNNQTTYTPGVDLDEGRYEWGVRGEETFSITPYSIREINIDYTEPNLPVPSIPGSDATIGGGNIEFKWTVSQIAGAPEYDTLEVYKDANLTADSLVGKYHTDSKSVVIDTLIIGDYFWRVKRFDEAGNNSDYTTARKFIVN